MSYWLRGEDSETVDIRQTTPGTEQLKYSYMYVASMKEYSFQSGLICIYWVSNMSKQTNTCTEGRGGCGLCLLCRPHELCCLLHILTCWEIDATLLCSDALRYICRDNEIAFCPDWMGWWHRYEIAVVFPWLLCIFHIDTSSCVLGCLTCIGLCWLNPWKISTQKLSPKLPST